MKRGMRRAPSGSCRARRDGGSGLEPAATITAPSNIRPAAGASVALAVLAVGAGVAACGGGDDTAARAGDGPEPPGRAGEVTLEIGRVDGPEEYVFGRVAGLALDGDGRIYVADVQAAVVRVYGPDGKHLHDVGRRGEGPGELGSPCCLAFGPEGRLWVRDGANGRYTAFELHDADSASFARQLRMAHSDTRRQAGVGFRGDTLVDVGIRSEERRTGDAVAMRTLGLHRAYVPLDGGEPRWEEVEEVPLEELGARSVTRTEGNSRTTLFLYPVSGPLHRVAHGPDGRWAEVVTDRYRVTVHAPDARETVVERETPRGPELSAVEEAAALERIEGYRTMVGRDFPEELAEIPDRKQPLRGVLLDADGRLWVELSAPDGEPRSAHLWSPDGYLVGARSWPAGVSLGGGHAVRGDVALGVAVDSLGVQRVVRVEWPKGG